MFRVDNGETRNTLLARLLAFCTGFVLGFGGAATAIGYLIAAAVFPSSSRWDLVHTILDALVLSFLAGGWTGVGLLSVASRYQFRQGWFHCADLLVISSLNRFKMPLLRSAAQSQRGNAASAQAPHLFSASS